MNKKRMLVLGAGSALALCNGAYAGDYDLTFTPLVGVGMQKYKMEWASYTSDGNKIGNLIKVDEYIPTITLGGSVSMGKFYFDAYLQQTGTSGETANTYNNHEETLRDYNLFKVDRRDYAVALGYGFDNGLSFFGGYKYGKSNASGHFRRSTYNSSGLENYDGNIYNQTADFTADGPFFGLGYGLDLGAGTLSLNGAVAFLDGKTKSTVRSVRSVRSDHLGATPGDLSDISSYTSKPSSTGLALGLAWKAPITKQLSYGISLYMYQYDFDKKTARNDDTGEETIPLKVKEESVGMRASLSYSF